MEITVPYNAVFSAITAVMSHDSDSDSDSDSVASAEIVSLRNLSRHDSSEEAHQL